MSQATALTAGAFLPIAATVLGLLQKRRIDALALIVLIAGAVGIAGSVLFTSLDRLLARISFVTAGVGSAFLLSVA